MVEQHAKSVLSGSAHHYTSFITDKKLEWHFRQISPQLNNFLAADWLTRSLQRKSCKKVTDLPYFAAFANQMKVSNPGFLSMALVMCLLIATENVPNMPNLVWHICCFPNEKMLTATIP